MTTIKNISVIISSLIMGYDPKSLMAQKQHKPLLAIKAPTLSHDDENSGQSLTIKKMAKRFHELHGEISREASFCLVATEQSTASSKKLREFLDDLLCLMQRTAGQNTDFYTLLYQQYMKDAERFERISQEAGFLELRPENLGLLLRNYAKKNNIAVTDFVRIGEYAKADDTLLPTEQKGMRDVINFMKNPISRKTFECFCAGRSELKEIEFSREHIEILKQLLSEAQNELNAALLEQSADIVEI